MNFFVKKNYPVLSGIFVICIAYLPLLSGITSIKFDALNYYFPVHYFFSDQLQSGTVPFWFYNLNGGFPMHADVGTPFWNFTLWIFPLLGKSVYMYTLAILSHVAIAAFGMYKLAKYFQLSNAIASVIMVCYVCSGYYAAHLTHPPYIFEIAYIPFIVLFFLKSVFSPNLKYAIYLGISLFFLINSGYPGFCIATLYFLAALFIALIFFNPEIRKSNSLLPSIKFLSLSCIIGVILSLPLIVSYISIINNYNRSNGFSISQSFTQYGGMMPRSLLSFFWPFASPLNASFYKTDATWNNIYCGIILSGFFLLALIKSKQKLKWPLVICGFLLLLMSFQGGAKMFFFKHLPLLSLLRNNGGFRIYFVLIILITGGIGLQYYLQTKDNLIKKIIYFFIGFLLLAMAFVAIQNQGNLFPTSLTNLSFHNINVNSLSIPFVVFVQSVISILLLIGALIFIKSKTRIILFIYADILLSFIANLPFTGVNGRHSAAFTQRAIATSITDINKVSYTKTMGTLNSIAYDTNFLNEPIHFLENNIGYDDAQYPSMMKNYSDLLYSGKLKKYDDKNCVFFVKQLTTENSLKNLELKNNSVSFNITSLENDSIVIFQNYHANWNGYLDGETANITQNADGFISMAIPNGTHNVVIKYQPVKPIIAFFISLMVWVFLIWYLVKNKRMQKNSTSF